MSDNHECPNPTITFTAVAQSTATRINFDHSYQKAQIEHGQVDSLDTLRAYAEALGGEVSIVVPRGPLTVRVA